MEPGSGSNSRSEAVEWAQLAWTVACGAILVVVFAYSTFPTKDSMATQMELRSKIEDTEMHAVRDDILSVKSDVAEMKADVKILLQRTARKN